MKEYRSFEEINRELKILKLQNQIDKEEIKLSIERTKEGLSPVYLAGSLASEALKKVLILKATAKLFGKRLLGSK